MTADQIPILSPLPDDTLNTVIADAKQLLLDGDALKPHTFLADAKGDIHHRGVDKYIKWPSFQHLLQKKGAVTAIEEFCKQTPPSSAAGHHAFTEQGMFLKQLMADIAMSPLPGLQTDPLYAQYLGEHIPLAAPMMATSDTIPTPAVTVRVPAMLQPAIRKPTYEQKMAEIEKGNPQTLSAGEFLRYILIDRDGKRFEQKQVLDAFETKSGYRTNYLMSNNVFRSTHTLPAPLQECLVGLSGSSNYFWDKSTYSSDDARHVTLDMGVDITGIVRKNAHLHPTHSNAGPER